MSCKAKATNCNIIFIINNSLYLFLTLTGFENAVRKWFEGKQHFLSSEQN